MPLISAWAKLERTWSARLKTGTTPLQHHPQPTNHLDIPAKEILEEACRNYDGAILLVSHDRYFVSQVRTACRRTCSTGRELTWRKEGSWWFGSIKHTQVANRIVAVEDKKLVVYEGDYKCAFPSVS